MGYEWSVRDLGLLLTLAVCTLAVRLLRLAARNRQLPELFVGLYFLLIPISISLSIRLPVFPEAHRALAGGITYAGFALAAAALYCFTWRVFRPDAAWARALAIGGSLVLAGLWVYRGWFVGFGEGRVATNSWTALPNYLPYFWAFFESARYYRMMRRRARLGLADPVVVNRFLLFAMWTGVFATLPMVGVIQVVLGESSTLFESGPILVVVRAMALPAGVALWLNFFPPARYCAWLRRRAEAPAAQTS